MTAQPWEQLEDPQVLNQRWREDGAQPHLWIADSQVPPGVCAVCGRARASRGHPWDMVIPARISLVESTASVAGERFTEVWLGSTRRLGTIWRVSGRFAAVCGCRRWRASGLTQDDCVRFLILHRRYDHGGQW